MVVMGVIVNLAPQEEVMYWGEMCNCVIWVIFAWFASSDVAGFFGLWDSLDGCANPSKGDRT